MPDSVERYRRKADYCGQRSLQAPNSLDKTAWLKLAEEWQNLAEVAAARSQVQDRENSN
jgi:hypothetical protein